MKNLYFFLIIANLLFLSSCKEEVSNPDTQIKVDPRLIGVWKQIILPPITETPIYCIRGIEITPSGLIHQLSVEISSGKFVIDDDQYYDSLWTENSNYVRYRDHLMYSSIDSGTFIMRGDTLRLISRQWDEELFIRSSIGANVTTPLNSVLSVMIDSNLTTNDKIHVRPSAYAVYEPSSYPSQFIINANLKKNINLMISINNFLEPQTYPLGGQSENRGYLSFLSGCVVINFSTDSLRTGSISIDTLDVINMRCSGKFHFDAIMEGTSTSNIINLLDGTFTVPIFSIVD